MPKSQLVVSRAYSIGRQGYGKEYKLKVSPDLVGPVISKDWFDFLVEQKTRTDEAKNILKELKKSGFGRRRSRFSRY